MANRLLAAMLRVFFHLLYNQMAFTYDIVAWVVSLGMWKHWVRSAASEITGPRVLELGHGPGHMQLLLLASQISVFGLDVSTKMGQQAKKRISAGGYTHKLTNGESQQLPYPGNSFHQVVATFPTEYILHQHSLAEIYRVLTPGGILIVVPVAWITGNSILQRAAATLFRVTGQAREWNDAYLKPFKETGFQVEVIRKKISNSIVLIVRASKPN